MTAGDYINEQRAEEIRNSTETSRSSWLVPMAAGLGIIGLGAVMMRSRIAEGGDLLSNIFNFLGIPKGISIAADAATNIGKAAARSDTTGLRSILSTTFDVKKGAVQLGPLDIIDDLRTSIELIGAVDKSAAEIITNRTIEYTNRELVTSGIGTGFFSQGLQRVTFKQVLEDQTTWSRVLGNNQLQVIKKAKDLSLVTDDMVLDRKIWFNANTQEVLDLRLRNLVSRVKEVDIGGQKVFERVARFDMFGQGGVLASISGVRGRGVAVLGPNTEFTGPRFFIGGNIFGLVQDPKTFKYSEALLDTGKSLRVSGDPLEVIAASRQGRLELDLPVRKGPLGPALSWMEQNFGVGPAFSNRPSFIQRWVTDPYQRFRAIQDGSGVIVRHPFKKEFGISRVMDAALGGDLPEINLLGGNAVSIKGGGEAVKLQNLSGRTGLVIPNRIGVFFGLTDEYSIVRRTEYEAYKKGAKEALIGQDLVVPTRKGGYRIRGKTIPENSIINRLTDIDRNDLSAVGFKSVSNRYSFYDVDKGLLAGLKDFAAYSIYRINSLASETGLGIGFAPSHKIATNIARLAAIPVAYEAGLKTAEYADYLSEKWTGISPIKAAASAYAGLRVLQQKGRELLGLRASFDFLDTYFPGSINSDGSTIARSVFAPMVVANAFLKKGNMAGALLGALGTFAGIGGVSPEQTSSDLMREYSGDKKVPIRKGRGWGLGYLPFSGGKVDHYDYSWYAKLTSDYKTKSLYGSKSEYWSYHANVFGIPFPTPSNLFGVLNVLNPYRLEERNYYTRPYPQTESPLASFPIIGPALSATLGQIMKPTVYREPTELPLLEAGLAERGLTANTARMMGIPAMNATAYEAEDPFTPLNRLRKQANIATEPLGIYKFVMEFFGVKFTPDVGTQYATSAMMQDPGRSLYDLELGGLFGQTELIRRFMLSDYSSPYQRAAAINPIKNNLPSWLPGTYSESKRDKDYFMDFTIGDAYSKLPSGEARLPGPGYEAINDLHSGQEGVYSDVDRFLILADVAPYSAAYKQYEKRVTSMDLDERWSTKVQEAIEQRQEVLGVDTRYKRYEEDIVALNMNTLAKGAYAPIRKAYDFLTHDVLAEIPYVGSKFFPFRDPYEQYRKMYVEGSEYASWDRPWEDIVRPMGYDMALEDPLTAAGKGAMLGFLVSGPMRWFTPVRSIIGGAGGSMFNFNPLAAKGGAIIGAGLSATRILTLNDQNMIPSHTHKEEEAISYMDTIAYIKGRMAENAGSGPQLANRTMMGAPNPIMYRSALPRSADRRYFDYFANIQDESRRSQIVEGLPDFMQQGLNSSWTNDYPSRDESDAQALEFVNNNQIPDPTWLGWHPEVSANATKLRLIQHGVNGVSDNIHRFGFYESHEVDLKTRLKEFRDQEINFVQSPMYNSFDQFLIANTKGLSKDNYRISNSSTPMGSRRSFQVNRDRDKENIEFLKNNMR